MGLDSPKTSQFGVRTRHSKVDRDLTGSSTAKFRRKWSKCSLTGSPDPPSVVKEEVQSYSGAARWSDLHSDQTTHSANDTNIIVQEEKLFVINVHYVLYKYCIEAKKERKRKNKNKF